MSQAYNWIDRHQATDLFGYSSIIECGFNYGQQTTPHMADVSMAVAVLEWDGPLSQPRGGLAAVYGLLVG